MEHGWHDGRDDIVRVNLIPCSTTWVKTDSASSVI